RVANVLARVGDDGPVALDADLAFVADWRAVGAGDEILRARVHRAHRAASDLCHQRGVDFDQIRIPMTAVARANIAGCDDAYLRLVQLQRLRERVAGAVRVAEGADHRDVVAAVGGVIPFGDDRGRFQGGMVL